MNEVVISGIIKGEFSSTSRDGVRFTLVNRGKNGNQDEFITLAYGESAKFLTQHAQSGQRVVLQGRLSSEKLDTQKYHTAITASRILAISDSSQGMDYSYAVVSGLASSTGLTRLATNDTAVINLNVSNQREYFDKKTEETQVYNTFLGATVWSQAAETMAKEYAFPLENVPVVFDGILKSRSYTDKETQETVYKIDVWVNSITSGSASTASASPKPAREEGKVPARSRSLDNSPF
jgi:single-stranded DNA-binding protein